MSDRSISIHYVRNSDDDVINSNDYKINSIYDAINSNKDLYVSINDKSDLLFPVGKKVHAAIS